jgi:hypothetical protein
MLYLSLVLLAQMRKENGKRKIQRFFVLLLKKGQQVFN